ncbi:hypothetical protein BH23GEM5_BH23GEM5_02960 [soil metagenome]|jgi:hypothetical protein|nr:hypothetical protein [Gemmatimonadota bacterium]
MSEPLVVRCIEGPWDGQKIPFVSEESHVVEISGYAIVSGVYRYDPEFQAYRWEAAKAAAEGDEK